MDRFTYLARLFRHKSVWFLVGLCLASAIVAASNQLHLPADTEALGNLQIDGLTASTVPYANSSQVLTSSSVTPTELGYLSGVTSSLCGINQSCDLTNKTLISPLVDVLNMSVQSTAPSVPTSGTDTLYDWNGALYLLNSSNVATNIVMGTALPEEGGTGLSSLATDELITSGSTSAGNFQQISNGTSGYVLTSNGSGSLPTFQAASGGTGGSGSGINILNAYNYNAELGSTTDWSNSGGTFNVTSTAADVANGTYSFGFLASASSQTVTSNLTTIPAGLYGQNCLLEFYYKGFDSNMTAEVTDGTTVIATQVLTAESGYTVQDMNFICPSSGSLEMELVSTGTSAQGYFDEVYLGRATNLGQTSQAQLVGQIKITGCSSNWSTTSTTMAAFSAESGCTYTVLNGTGVSAPSTNIPGITFSSLPPGNYVLDYAGSLNTIYSSASGQASFQFSDGTNSANEISYIQGATSSVLGSSSEIQQTISYSTAQSNITLEVLGRTSNSGSSAAVYGTTAAPGVISVYRFPTSSQQSWNPSTAPASWAGFGSPISGTTTSTSFADLGSISGSVSTQGTPRNILCSTATSEVGITCTLPKLGNYEVCFQSSVSDNTTGNAVVVQMTDGSGTVVIPAQEATIAGTNYDVPMSGCNTYTASLTSETFKIQAKVSGGTGTVNVNGFSVTGLDQSMQAPMTIGSVTSTTTGKEHIERAVLSSAASIVSQSGSWLSSASYAAVGQYTINFTAGEFSAAPTCFAMANANSNGLCFGENNFTSSTGTIQCVTSNNASGVALQINVLCMGPD